MRRSVGVVLTAALALALVPRIASALASFPQPSSYDLRPHVFRAVFGEGSDAAASIAASYGDRTSESPLRELALNRRAGRHSFQGATIGYGTGEVRLAQQPAAPQQFAPFFGGRIIQPSDLRFVPLSLGAAPPAAMVPPADRVAVPSIANASLGVGSYEPATFVTPEPDTQAFEYAAPASRAGTQLAAAAAPAPAALAPGAAVNSVLVPVSMHVGRLQFDGNLVGDGEQAHQQQLGLDDSAYGAGANFGVRAGSRQVGVDVSSSYEHLMRDDTTANSSAALAPAWQIGGDSTPAIPNYADVSKLALGANVAVPVTHTVTLNLNYNAQRLLGGYGLPGLANLDATDNSYGGNVTFQIPRWSSEISVGARQYHYQDNLAPLNTFSDTRENVNLTVKF